MKKSDRTQDTGNIIEIADLTLPELQVYTSLNEAQLLHYFEPEPGIFIAESPKVIERALDFGCEPISLINGAKGFGYKRKKYHCKTMQKHTGLHGKT